MISKNLEESIDKNMKKFISLYNNEITKKMSS